MPLTAQATLVWLSALLAPLQWMTLASVLEAFLAILALAVYNGMVNAAADGARNMIASGQYDPDARPTASGSPPMAPAGMPGPQPPY